MLGTVLSRGAARGLGFAKLVSVGNEADLGVGELVELLAADADTRVILLFLETVRDAARARARRARGARRRQAGGRLQARPLRRWASALARSHTGALAGERRRAGRVFPRLRHRARGHAGDADRDRAAARRAQAAAIWRARRRVARGDHHRRRRGERGGPPRHCSASRPCRRTPQAPIIDLTMAANGRRPTAPCSRSCSRSRNATRCWRWSARPRSSIRSSRSSRSSRATARRQAAGGVHHAAGRAIARAARAGGHRGLPHAGSLRRRLAAYFSWKSPGKRRDGTAIAWPKDLPLKGKLTEAQSQKLFTPSASRSSNPRSRARRTTRTRFRIRSR